MIAMGKNIRFVVVQFSFSNIDVVPLIFKKLGAKAPDRYVNHDGVGKLQIEPTENCSVEDVVGQIEQEGFEMVDAFFQPRQIKRKDSEGYNNFYIVRFVFCRTEFANVSEKFKEVRQMVRNAFLSLGKLAMWRVRGYLNPCFDEGEKIRGQNSVSLNFDARKPLFLRDGTPVLVWNRNDKGEKIGCMAPRLQPKHRLHVSKEAILLVSNQQQI